MHWKLKSLIQNTISILPAKASYAAYYWIQRHFGELRHFTPVSGISYGINTWKRIVEQDCNPSDKVFFEIGTGRVPLVPLSYWLMGAKKTITMDLNPYLKWELVSECLKYISDNKEDIQNLFGSLLDNKRFDDLLAFIKQPNHSLHNFLDMCKIEYIAPGDASDTGLLSHSIDYYTSCTVLEHIPPDILKKILLECNRIVSKEGLFVHIIDYSDHFSHSDKNITAINFLRFSDNEWNHYAGNRYMYMNRLRHDDYVSLFESVGHKIIAEKLNVDLRSQTQLENGILQLDARFKSKPHDVIAISSSLIVAKQKTQSLPIGR